MPCEAIFDWMFATEASCEAALGLELKRRASEGIDKLPLPCCVFSDETGTTDRSLHSVDPTLLDWRQAVVCGMLVDVQLRV